MGTGIGTRNSFTQIPGSQVFDPLEYPYADAERNLYKPVQRDGQIGKAYNLRYIDWIAGLWIFVLFLNKFFFSFHDFHEVFRLSTLMLLQGRKHLQQLLIV